MKISSYITENFNITRDNLKTLITFARWSNRAEETDSNFVIDDPIALENAALEIINVTFGEREGFISGDLLDYYAERLGMDVHKWVTRCGNIDF